MSRRRRLVLGGVLVSAVLLFIPFPRPDVDLPDRSTAFRWDADELFAELEAEFERAGGASLIDAVAVLELLGTEMDVISGSLDGSEQPPYAALDRLATLQFEAAVQGAAHPRLLPIVEEHFVRTRVALMKAAADWSMERRTHDILYEVLFGGRIALDEALIQAGTAALPPLLNIEEIPSATPSIEVEGVRVHSGDVLLSRGGAPTSALIARGNDFPNTFSHAALAHVDAETGEGTVIESLIETGSILSSVDDYLASKKHRVLVLRMRPDHPALIDDPTLPHRAAEAMLQRMQVEHIPYDFAMDWQDPTAAFCSEVVYHAYADRGVELWQLRSAMSAPGLASWLAVMGVREFTSLVPSDVEYDPQLRAVVEWRDAPALMDFRLDNAVIDALLEEAERGASLGYPWYMLPLARVLKVYSIGQSMLGAVPMVPEGMSAQTALRVQSLVDVIHPTVKEDLAARAEIFRADNGYEAPYWTLVEQAKEALAARLDDLAPVLAVGS